MSQIIGTIAIQKIIKLTSIVVKYFPIKLPDTNAFHYCKIQTITKILFSTKYNLDL